MRKGTRGLALHRHACQEQPDAISCPFVSGAAGDVEQAQDAKASASVNPALFDREQAPDRHIDSGIPCSKRLKIFRNERAL